MKLADYGHCDYGNCDSKATLALTIEERPYPEPADEDSPAAVSYLRLCEEHRDQLLSKCDTGDEDGL